MAGRILSLMHAIWMTAERPGEEDGEEEQQEHARRHTGMAASLQPYIHTDLFAGEYRLGLKRRF